MLWILFQAILYQTAFYQTFTTWTKWPQKLPNKLFLLVPVSIWPGAFAILATKVPAISWYQWFQAMVDFQLIKMSCGLPGREGFKAVTLSIISVNSWKTEISPATKFLSIVLRFSVLSSSSLLCSAEDCRGRDCHPTGHSLFRTCKVPKLFHQANTTHTTLSSKLLSVTAKRMYAFWTINTMPPCPHAINSDSQHVQSASERKRLQSSLLCSDSQGKHCHPTGHSLFRTCKVPKSFHQANTTHTTFSSKLLSVTAKRMYAFWTINTMPPCPHAINSDSQHVQSASERKHLQSSLLCSDSQGKHCHPTGHSLFRTCKVHI